MEKKRQTVIIVTAYGEDNYYQKRFEDIVGIYTSVDKAIAGAKEDGLTNRQLAYLNSINAFSMLAIAMVNNSKQAFQVNYEEETDGRRKQCEVPICLEHTIWTNLLIPHHNKCGVGTIIKP